MLVVDSVFTSHRTVIVAFIKRLTAWPCTGVDGWVIFTFFPSLPLPFHKLLSMPMTVAYMSYFVSDFVFTSHKTVTVAIIKRLIV